MGSVGFSVSRSHVNQSLHYYDWSEVVKTVHLSYQHVPEIGKDRVGRPETSQ